MSKVVVTGAGAGVGPATAEEFPRQGYGVGLLARDPRRLERTATELRRSWERLAVRHRTAFWLAAAICFVAVVHQVAKRLDI